ncbi:MAG: putative tricarboxylic transport rane protein [Betaproteobacteria bacterium]|jgi:putative tricarboxylic transport membrane protein|nr:putative tricarboxylic transport rane protein [Betaproteobacteria bacterium]
MTWDFLMGQFAAQFALWWVIWLGILLGIVVGILPGFSPQNTLIMLLPLTLAVPVEQALAFMVALYCANHLAGGVPAILMRIPGSGGAAATTLDGYPMARKGQAQQAIVLSFTASVFGGLITTLATIALLPWLSQLGLYLRSVEMVIIMLFGLTLIAVIAAKDTLKGLISGFFGLLIGVVGTDHVYSEPRATMGFLELYDGVPLVAALIGLFAVSEALVMIEEKMIVDDDARERAMQASWADTIEGLRITVQKWWHIVWTAFIGLFIGIVPGAGASIAAFVAYQQSRMWSKHPELYGTGIPEGVIAPESANNGVTSGTLVPMMALGVPGGSTAAVMMIVLQYHGMVMGPRLFSTNPELAYGVFVSMAVAYIFMIITILPLARYMARIVLIETKYLVPIIILVTVVAAFSERQYAFDMGLALVFGVIGYIAHKTNYHVTAMLVGVILGPLFEQYLVRALRISEGDLTVLFTSPVGNALWALLAFSLLVPLGRSWWQGRASRSSPPQP